MSDEIKTLLQSAEAHSKAAQESAALSEKQIAEAKRLMAEKEAGPWRPKQAERYWFARNDGDLWFAGSTLFENQYSGDLARVGSGNCFRTEQEAQEVATQRNFMTDRVSAGDLAPTEEGYCIYLDNKLNVQIDFLRWPSVERKFSSSQKCFDWVEKWGGEAEVARRLKVGWM